MSCNFFEVHYTYNWETAEALFKKDVGYGILSRESAVLDLEECYWYSANDINTIFDMPLKISAMANSLGTLISVLNFLHSLLLWCKVVTSSSIRFVCHLTVLCICCAAITQMVFMSDMCKWDKCKQVSMCYLSQRTIYHGIDCSTRSFILKQRLYFSSIYDNKNSSLMVLTEPVSRVLAHMGLGLFILSLQ